jgi:hypothetical protein
VVCSCICPTDSANPKCADPNLISIKKTYRFDVDRDGNVYVAVSSGSCSECTTYNLVPTMANPPATGSQSQFVGSSPTGFTGILDAPDSFFEQLGMIPCSLNAEGVCIPLAGGESRRAQSNLDIESNFSVAYADRIFRSSDTLLLAGPAQYHERSRAQRRAFLAGGHAPEIQNLLASVDDSGLVGVQTPLLCVKAGNGVTWSITSLNGITHYPQYIPDSLYNTNPNFDYGAFQNLKKDVEAGRAVASFNQIFSSPGVYAFYDAADRTKQTIVGVVNTQVNCPQSFSRNPIQPLSADLLKDFPSGDTVQAVITPDYALITGIGIAILATLIFGLVMLYLVSITGWGRSVIRSRRYREIQKDDVEDLHTMATKKYIVKTGSQTDFEEQNKLDTSGLGDNQALIDLEGFNIQTLFDKLQDQTNLVSEQLSKQKDDVKEFYDKVERTLTMRSGAYSSKPDSEVLERAQKREENVLGEIARRKLLGSQYLEILSKEIDAENKAGLLPHGKEQDLMLLNSVSILAENVIVSNADDIGERVLEYRKQIQAFPRKKRIFFDSKIGEGALLVGQRDFEIDKILKIKIPCAGSKMLLKGQGDPVPVPKTCCIHPETGHVVPIEGNVWFDDRRKAFVFGSNLDIESILEGPIPFVCNSLNAQSECYPPTAAPYSHLLPERNGWPLNDRHEMIEPFFGFRVPVLGVTVDFRTGELRAVGGTVVDPETGLIKAIKIGDFYLDPSSHQPLVITGVAIHPTTLKVVPVGMRYPFFCCSHAVKHRPDDFCCLQASGVG